MSSWRRLLTLDPAGSLAEPVLSDVDESPAPPFFLDLVVNGAALRDLVPYAQDVITELYRVSLPDIDLIVDVLLGRREHAGLGAGRVPLLVCGMCGDLDCGALTVRVSASGEEVRWSDWRWVDRSDQLMANFPDVKNLRRQRRFAWPWS